jgi:ABC-2 type transport system ATP-binding protein
MQQTLSVSDLKQELATAGSKPKLILKGLNFSIPTGSLTGFIGVNGAGKTTTIKTLLGFIQAKSGIIDFFGEKALSPSGRQRIGFMPERPYFYEFLTGREFLGLHWKLRGHKLDQLFEQRCDEVLKDVDLERGKNLRLRQFSKGMLQRIGIAQAIIHNPEFLLLDEPMSGLDPDGRVLIKNIIKKHHEKGATIFFSSHLLQDMEELCDRLVIIDQGQIIYEGSLVGLGAQRREEVEISWRRQGELNLHTEECSGLDLQAKIDELRLAKSEILKISQKKISLEEAFILLRKSRE